MNDRVKWFLAGANVYLNPISVESMLTTESLRVALIGELFCHIFCFVRAIFNLPLFLGFFASRQFHSDRTPPYIDTYLQSFQKFGNNGKNYPIRMNLQ